MAEEKQSRAGKHKLSRGRALGVALERQQRASPRAGHWPGLPGHELPTPPCSGGCWPCHSSLGLHSLQGWHLPLHRAPRARRQHRMARADQCGKPRHATALMGLGKVGTAKWPHTSATHTCEGALLPGHGCDSCRGVLTAQPLQGYAAQASLGCCSVITLSQRC